MSKIGRRSRRAGAVLGVAALIGAGFGASAGVVGAEGAPTTTAAPTTAPPTTAPPTTVPETQCPASTPNAMYVRYLYVEALQRCPDAGGLSYWTNRLDDGASRHDVANYFVHAPEVLAGSVGRFYGQVLHRGPTDAEFGSAMTYLATAKDIENLKATLLASQEYYDSVDDNAHDWLASLYPIILEGREPDESGMAYWSGVLGDSPSQALRLHVAWSFVHSTEEHTFWVNCSYQAALLRSGSTEEVAWWVGWLGELGPGYGNTQGMWANFLASAEGQHVATLQPNPPAED